MVGRDPLRRNIPVKNLIKIKLRCPVTTKAFDTGMRTTGREALTNNVFRQGTISCVFCDQLHSLDQNAFFEAEPNGQSSDALWRPNP
jgi:hypothetical protein